MFEGKRILLVDDEADFRDSLAKELVGRGYFVYPVGDCDTFAKSLESINPDLVLIDKMIGEDDGFDLIHKIRQHPELSPIPIIIVTGSASLENKKEAIFLGADDFIAKPISIDDLELRIVANLRRAKNFISEEHLIRVGDIDVDLRRQSVKISGQILDLTTTEYKIFLELFSRRGEVVSREQLAQRFLSLRNSNARTLDVHINSLRKKLGSSASFLKTVRGRGYLFDYNPDGQSMA